MKKAKKPEVRFLSDMRKVLYDQKWLKKAQNVPLYYMYRGVKPPHLFIGGGGKDEGDLRYDITVIPARMLGEEFVKTKGHEHIGNFQELYHVLKGRAIFLLQKAAISKSQRKFKEIEDVYYVKAKKGNFILIPPGYGHITINPSKKNLKIGNWVSKKCKSDYKSIEMKKGLCYYYTKSGWLKNINYKKIPKLRPEKPQKSMPKNLNFLTPPFL